VGTRLRQLWSDELQIQAPSHVQLDVLNSEALAAFLKHSAAPVVVNVAAWADVDGAETERDNYGGRVYALNALFPGKLAALCAETNKYLIHVSTDYVFDGTRAERPYTEHDETNPLCWYAVAKADGERRVLAAGEHACVARIEMPFSGREHAKQDIARTVRARLEAGMSMSFVTDQRITPVFLDDAVRALRALMELRYTGVVHVAAADWTTPYDFARAIARRLKLGVDLVEPAQFELFAAQRPARRPQHSWLDVSQFSTLCGPGLLRTIDAELDAWLAQAG
jgi:dTDP-4-dehydrorhamnose reductase